MLHLSIWKFSNQSRAQWCAQSKQFGGGDAGLSGGGGGWRVERRENEVLNLGWERKEKKNTMLIHCLHNDCALQMPAMQKKVSG